MVLMYVLIFSFSIHHRITSSIQNKIGILNGNFKIMSS
jgi:hypothetical protein